MSKAMKLAIALLTLSAVAAIADETGLEFQENDLAIAGLLIAGYVFIGENKSALPHTMQSIQNASRITQEKDACKENPGIVEGLLRSLI
jgi:hypothetical protein